MSSEARALLNKSLGGNMLCELILLDSERHEIITAYDRQMTQRPLPTLAVQMFVHNVRNNSSVAVYRAHISDLISFAETGRIEWLEERIVSEYRKDRDSRTKPG